MTGVVRNIFNVLWTNEEINRMMPNDMIQHPVMFEVAKFIWQTDRLDLFVIRNALSTIKSGLRLQPRERLSLRNTTDNETEANEIDAVSSDDLDMVSASNSSFEADEVEENPTQDRETNSIPSADYSERIQKVLSDFDNPPVHARNGYRWFTNRHRVELPTFSPFKNPQLDRQFRQIFERKDSIASLTGVLRNVIKVLWTGDEFKKLFYKDMMENPVMVEVAKFIWQTNRPDTDLVRNALLVVRRSTVGSKATARTPVQISCPIRYSNPSPSDLEASSYGLGARSANKSLSAQKQRSDNWTVRVETASSTSSVPTEELQPTRRVSQLSIRSDDEYTARIEEVLSCPDKPLTTRISFKWFNNNHRVKLTTLSAFKNKKNDDLFRKVVVREDSLSSRIAILRNTVKILWTDDEFKNIDSTDVVCHPIMFEVVKFIWQTENIEPDFFIIRKAFWTIKSNMEARGRLNQSTSTPEEENVSLSTSIHEQQMDTSLPSVDSSLPNNSLNLQSQTSITSSSNNRIMTRMNSLIESQVSFKCQSEKTIKWFKKTHKEALFFLSVFYDRDMDDLVGKVFSLESSKESLTCVAINLLYIFWKQTNPTVDSFLSDNGFGRAWMFVLHWNQEISQEESNKAIQDGIDFIQKLFYNDMHFNP